MLPLGESPRRIQSYTKQVIAQPSRPAGWVVGLYLSKSQADKAGHTGWPHMPEFYGKDVGEATKAAEDFINKHFPGYEL